MQRVRPTSLHREHFHPFCGACQSVLFRLSFMQYIFMRSAVMVARELQVLQHSPITSFAVLSAQMAAIQASPFRGLVEHSDRRHVYDGMPQLRHTSHGLPVLSFITRGVSSSLPQLPQLQLQSG